MNALPDVAETRRQRFERALAEVRHTDGSAVDERRWRRLGVALMTAGMAVAIGAFVVSLRLADTRDVVSMVVLGELGMCLCIVGATFIVCHTVTRALRLVVLRLLYPEGRS